MSTAGRTLIGLLLLSMTLSAYTQDLHIAAEVRMLALGDSYTIGESVAPEERWPRQFMDALRKRGIRGPDPDYIATTGWTTGELLEGIAASQEKKNHYNLVSILIGVNNQYRGLPVERYEPELRRIIDHALGVVGQDTSRVFLLSIPDYAYTPFGKGKPSISREIDVYNRVNRDLATEYHLAYFDITPISREGLEQDGLVASDGLHPSAAQYGRWVEAIMAQLF